MLFAEIDWLGTIIAAGSTALILLLGGGVTAYLALRKGNAETAKTTRDGVIEGWEKITTKLQEQHTACVGRTEKLEAQVDLMQIEIAKLHVEISTLRQQITARETERVEQRGEIRTLTKKLDDVKKPDAVELADALAPKLAEAMATAAPGQPATAATPVVIVGQKESVVVKVDKDAIATAVGEAVAEKKAETETKPLH